MKKPAGVVVLVAICAVLALAQAFAAAVNAAAGESAAAAVGALFVAAFAVVGAALWRLRESGRQGAVALACLQLLKSLVALAGLVAGLRAGIAPLTPGPFVLIVAMAALLAGAPIAVLYYLTRARVKALFIGPADRSGSNPPPRPPS